MTEAVSGLFLGEFPSVGGKIERTAPVGRATLLALRPCTRPTQARAPGVDKQLVVDCVTA